MNSSSQYGGITDRSEIGFMEEPARASVDLEKGKCDP